MKRITSIIAFSTATVLSPLAHADLASDLQGFYNQAAFTNITIGGAYQGQTANMLTPGGITWRIPSRNYQLMSIQLPRLRMGCGGIDLFTGGFSFINSDQLVAMLRNIGSAALSYGLMIAIKTISPESAQVIEKLQSWAQKANAMNINSCEAARNLIQGGFKAVAGREWGCISAKLMAGDDYQKAKEACGTAGEANTTEAPDEEKPNLPMTKGNIAWKAIMQRSPFAGDVDLAQAAMSISGTVIIGPKPAGSSEEFEIKPFPSIIGNSQGQRLIEAMLYGGTATVYGCNDGYGADQCLDLQENVTINIRQGLKQAMYYQLLMLAVSIYIDSDIGNWNADLVKFVDSATLPVYRYMTTMVASGGPSLAIKQAELYAEYLARDLINTYLNDIIVTVTKAVMASRNNTNDESFKRFIKGTEQALDAINKHESKTLERIRTRMAMNEEMLLYQRMLAARIPAAMFVGETPGSSTSRLR